MSKQRDAGTGKYLSEKDAATRPAETWVIEHDQPKKKRNTKLGIVYAQLMERKKTKLLSFEEVVTVADINKVFEEAGLQLPNG